jgi:hypothetical protein
MKVLSIDIGSRNFAYCLLDNDIIVRWNLITLNENIVRCLDNEHFELTDDTIVVIEQQPQNNPKMRVVSARIETYFTCRYPQCVIKKYKSMDKFKVLSLTHMNELHTYYGRKKLSIEHCRTVVPSDWLPFFESYKKKDDLSDCYLQGVCFIRSNQPF